MHMPSEVGLCIAIADVLDHRTDTLLLVACEGDEPLLDIITEEVTERAAEILVARIGEERTRISKHSHET